MNFEERIGEHIYIYLKTPIAWVGASELVKSFGAKLIGAEAGGIWIESEAMPAEFEPALRAYELKEGGQEAVGEHSLGFFLPFSEVHLIIGFRAKLE